MLDKVANECALDIHFKLGLVNESIVHGNIKHKTKGSPSQGKESSNTESETIPKKEAQGRKSALRSIP